MVYIKLNVFQIEVFIIIWNLRLIESMMEYVLEENADNELILTTKYEYFYENENCSGDISFQMTSNYSLVQVDKKRN